MTGLEICLVIIGLICVACSFLFSEHLMAQDMKEEMIGGVNVASVTEEIVKREVEAEVANVIDDKIWKNRPICWRNRSTENRYASKTRRTTAYDSLQR